LTYKNRYHYKMTRFENLQQFINVQLNAKSHTLNAITGDASFRRYYRLNHDNKHLIVMDSDPKKVNNEPYISLNKVFTEQGFLLPSIIASDEQQGFFILSDLGSTHLADMLDDKNKLTTEQVAMWHSSCELLTNAMLLQPTVTVHRDYHSRNIMYSNGQWAIIDYQDAVQGPLCYDLVSLLRDCYYKLPESELSSLLDFAYKEFIAQGLVKNTSFSEFKYWFDLTGIQRHLKAAGIFCRLYLRDSKTGYLDNILPTLDYIVEVAAHYSELSDLSEWIKNTIVPKVTKQLAVERT